MSQSSQVSGGHSVVLWRLWLSVVPDKPTKGQGHLLTCSGQIKRSLRTNQDTIARCPNTIAPAPFRFPFDRQIVTHLTETVLQSPFEMFDSFGHKLLAHPRAILAIQGCECSTAWCPPIILFSLLPGASLAIVPQGVFLSSATSWLPSLWSIHLKKMAKGPRWLLSLHATSTDLI